MKNDPFDVSPFAIIAADRLGFAVKKLIDAGVLDSRSEAGDLLLEYCATRFGDSDPIGDLGKCIQEYDERFVPKPKK